MTWPGRFRRSGWFPRLVNGTFGTVFVVVLTLYFVAGLESMKPAAYSLVPASKRAGFIDISETIAASVGKYLGGMVILAALVGGTLLGLLGALIACPTSASILPILKKSRRAGTIFALRGRSSRMGEVWPWCLRLLNL